MRRRALISLMGGATVIWPLASRGQRPQPMPVIGFLTSYSASADTAGIGRLYLSQTCEL